MDIKNWRRSISSRSVRLGKSYYDRQQQPPATASENNNNDNSKKKMKSSAAWRVLWRKLLKEKKNMFPSSFGGRVHVQSAYDYETYMQNFDEGQNSLIEEADVMFRSFSMRFADPSKLFPDQKQQLILI